MKPDDFRILLLTKLAEKIKGTFFAPGEGRNVWYSYVDPSGKRILSWRDREDDVPENVNITAGITPYRCLLRMYDGKMEITSIEAVNVK